MSESRDWLHFAAEDLRVAELVLQAGIYNQVCFHAQQCVEKSLKAWLAHHGHLPPRVHQLSLLLKLCPQPLPFPDKVEANILALDRFYIPTRRAAAVMANDHCLMDCLTNQMQRNRWPLPVRF